MTKFKNIEKQKKTPLKVIVIGDGVTKNLTLYEYGEDIIAVDYGIGFPDTDDFGVDFIIPDMTYLLDNADRIRGLFITHAHADHFAAVPYLLEQLNVPVYANKLTLAYIDEMLTEKKFKKLQESVSKHLMEPDMKPVTVGAFTVSAFALNHSVPGSLGYVIDTPQGRCMHMADFKIDEAPIIDEPVDMDKIRELSKDGILCLASDCLGARSKGDVATEQSLTATFPKVMEIARGKQLFITTISSNISRMHQIISAAIKEGRKVVPTGRSVDTSIKISRNLGYLPFGDDVFVSLKKASDYNQKDIVYIIAGCFGQSGSALDKLARAEHPQISLKDGALVVYSSEPNPPGVDVAVERVDTELILKGAEIIDHMNMDNLHVSGHGHRDELLRMAKVANPKYFIPVGGGVIHVHAYANMMYDNGFPKGSVFELQEGDVVEFRDGNATMGKKLEVHDMLYDGTGVSPMVIKDREALSNDGLFVVLVPMSKESRKVVGNADIVTRGFIYVKESKALMGRSRDVVNKVLDRYPSVVNDWSSIRTKIEKEISKFLFKEIRRTPLIIVHAVFI